MTYREPPALEPLIVVGSHGVQCIDLATGKPRWEHRRRLNGTVRCAPNGDAVLVCNGATLTVLARADGAERASRELWFDVHKVVAHGEHVVLAGIRGAACFRNGAYVWGVRSERLESTRWLGTDELIWWVEDARGQKVADLPFWSADGFRSDIGLIIGQVVSQTDFES